METKNSKKEKIEEDEKEEIVEEDEKKKKKKKKERDIEYFQVGLKCQALWRDEKYRKRLKN